jgi:hypothetical protein
VQATDFSGGTGCCTGQEVLQNRRSPEPFDKHHVCFHQLVNALCTAHVGTKGGALRAGCLPTLATIPIFWGLYRTLSNVSQAGLLTEGFYWIPSLSGPASLADQQAGETSTALALIRCVLLTCFQAADQVHCS